MTNLMPAGTYYVGDLCYVLGDRWDEVCDLIISGNSCLDGVFTMNDGTQFAIFSTAYGDGEYQDQYGKSYCVDAGSIGCVLTNANGVDLSRADKLGNIVEFRHNFYVYEEGGVITIGMIKIDTSAEYEDYDDDC